jgi:hypothetical protein
LKMLAVILNLLGAGPALAASWFWFKSARTKLPKIDPLSKKPRARADMSSLNAAIVESAGDNKRAAILTGLSTIAIPIATAIGAS